jgi:hypothetical protein
MKRAVLLLFTVVPVCSGQWRSDVIIDPDERIMLQVEADLYVAKHVDPMVSKVLHDPSQPLSLRDLGNALSGQIQRKEIRRETIAAYYPGKKDWTFDLEYVVREQGYILYEFVPALKDFETKWAKQGFNPKQIAVLLAAMWAHEEVHYKLGVGTGAKYPLSGRSGGNDFWTAMREEADATGQTITEIFRPILRQGGKLPQDWMDNSETFRRLGDNSGDLRWIQAFAKLMK